MSPDDTATMMIRRAEPRDVPACAEIYAAGVHACGPAAYTPEQIAAWSAFAADPVRFPAFILEPMTLIAVDDDDRPLGFCGLDPDGRVASLYVAPQAMRRGIASTLLRHMSAHAQRAGLTHLWTQASYFSLPLFLRHGFELDHVDTAIYGEVSFTRHILRCPVSRET